MARLAVGALLASFLLAELSLPASAQVAPGARDEPPESERLLERVELRSGGARDGEPLPMLVALHGRGERPESLRARFERLDVRARIVLVRAPLPLGGGFEWFRVDPAGSLASMARELAAMLPRLVATIEAVRASRPTVGRPVVVGFSQGAMVGYALALAQPTLIERVIAVAGFLLPALLLEAPASAALPPMIGFHGTDDEVVPIEAHRLSVRALQRRGASAELHEYEGEGHALGTRVQRDVARTIRTALRLHPPAHRRPARRALEERTVTLDADGR